MPSPIDDALDRFFSRVIDHAKQSDHGLKVEFDPQWPSPCYQQDSAEEGEWVDWLPVLRQDSSDFSDLNEALSLNIPEELQSFWGRYWSEHLGAAAPKGQLTLLFCWNPEDFTQYMQNQVGHVLMKRRLGQAETLFFAVTDEEDFILSVDVNSGEVVLEQVGLPPKEVIAPNLTSFIESLQPV